VAVAGRRQTAGSELYQISRQIALGQLQGTALLQALKHRSGLHDQVVHRKMRRLQGDRLLKLLPPAAEGLPRQALNQIKAPALQAASALGVLQPVGSLKQISAAMAAAQGFEHRITEALPPQAHARHPSRQVAAKALLIEAGGVKLQAQFRAGSQAITAPQRL